MAFKKLYILLFISGLLTTVSSAQDVRFSQYGFTPHFVNPAAIASDNYLAGYINYRSQRVSTDLTFKTVSVLGKYPLLNKEGKRVGAVGVGFLSDRGEGLSEINVQGFTGTLAYNFYLNDQWAISAGGGVAYTNTEATLGDFTTGSQWVDNIGFVPDASTGESFGDLNTNYLSFNGGLRLYKEDNKGNVMHYLGLSMFHFNQPDVSFMDSQLEKPIRYSAQAGVRVFQNDNFGVSPEVIAEQSADNEFLGIGANLTYYLKDNDPYDPIKKGSINLKVRNVISEAIILALQFNQPNYSIGFSYDIGLSPDNTEPAYNATEFAFTIRKKITRKVEKKKVVSNYSIKEIKSFYQQTEESNSGKSNKVDDQGDNSGTKQSDGSSDSNTDKGTEEVQFELKREFSFGFNDSSLDNEDKLYLDDLASLLKLNPDLKIEITGHADDIGTEKANKKISEERADVVETYLISVGVDKNRLKSSGRGAKEPLVPNDSETNRAKNRRVEFSIYKTGN